MTREFRKGDKAQTYLPGALRQPLKDPIVGTISNLGARWASLRTVKTPERPSEEVSVKIANLLPLEGVR